jgi:hypothetical protein
VQAAPVEVPTQDEERVRAGVRAEEAIINLLQDRFLDLRWEQNQIRAFCTEHDCRWSSLTQAQAEALLAALPAPEEPDSLY